MERVVGDSVAIASSTNSCGTGLRGLTANRASSSGRKDVLRRDFDMRAKIALRSFLPADDDFISLTCHLANCRHTETVLWKAMTKLRTRRRQSGNIPIVGVAG